MRKKHFQHAACARARAVPSAPKRNRSHSARVCVYSGRPRVLFSSPHATDDLGKSNWGSYNALGGARVVRVGCAYTSDRSGSRIEIASRARASICVCVLYFSPLEALNASSTPPGCCLAINDTAAGSTPALDTRAGVRWVRGRGGRGRVGRSVRAGNGGGALVLPALKRTRRSPGVQVPACPRSRTPSSSCQARQDKPRQSTVKTRPSWNVIPQLRIPGTVPGGYSEYPDPPRGGF